MYPPSLSQSGSIRLGNKSELYSKCLEPKVKPADNSPVVDPLILDAAVLVNALRPGTSRTSHDYANDVFLPYVRRQMEGVKRIDIVWDVYIENSLKKTTRCKEVKVLEDVCKMAVKYSGTGRFF